MHRPLHVGRNASLPSPHSAILYKLYLCVEVGTRYRRVITSTFRDLNAFWWKRVTASTYLISLYVFMDRLTASVYVHLYSLCVLEWYGYAFFIDMALCVLSKSHPLCVLIYPILCVCMEYLLRLLALWIRCFETQSLRCRSFHLCVLYWITPCCALLWEATSAFWMKPHLCVGFR